MCSQWKKTEKKQWKCWSRHTAMLQWREQHCISGSSGMKRIRQCDGRTGQQASDVNNVAEETSSPVADHTVSSWQCAQPSGFYDSGNDRQTVHWSAWSSSLQPWFGPLWFLLVPHTEEDSARPPIWRCCRFAKGGAVCDRFPWNIRIQELFLFMG